MSVATVIATGVNADGQREVLGVDVFTTEDGAGWMAFLRGLVARGLSGVDLVISDAHVGLKNAIASVLPGASWQRCRTHAMENLLTRVPKAAQAMVATQVRAQFARVVDQLEGQFPAAAEFLCDAEADLLGFATFPVEHWRQIWSNNTQESSTRSSVGAPTSSGSSRTEMGGLPLRVPRRRRRRSDQDPRRHDRRLCRRPCRRDPHLRSHALTLA